MAKRKADCDLYEDSRHWPVRKEELWQCWACEQWYDSGRFCRCVIKNPLPPILECSDAVQGDVDIGGNRDSDGDVIMN